MSDKEDEYCTCCSKRLDFCECGDDNDDHSDDVYKKAWDHQSECNH